MRRFKCSVGGRLAAYWENEEILVVEDAAPRLARSHVAVALRLSLLDPDFALIVHRY